LTTDPKLIAEVKAFFEEFVAAYPKDDLDRYLNLFSQDENLVMFGTSHKWLGWEEYKSAPAEEKERLGEITLTYDWLKVNAHETVAWIAAEVKVQFKIGEDWNIVPARLTGVAKKIQDKWKIVQGHISVVSG
jgi:ketosteroid isomerase-like protein